MSVSFNGKLFIRMDDSNLKKNNAKIKVNTINNMYFLSCYKFLYLEFKKKASPQLNSLLTYLLLFIPKKINDLLFR